LFGGWFSSIGGFKTLVGAVGLILGACILLPCFLPLVIQSIKSIIEATIERKTAAHVMMLWKYKLINQKKKKNAL
jgi:ABC-type tungstate transport system substrate-binding protein